MPQEDGRYKIAIVGAVPAGLISALTIMERCPDRRLDVTIHEREPASYTTLCGEGISRESLERFTAFDSKPYTAQSFPGAMWWFPGDLRVYVDQPCFTIERCDWIPAMAKEFEKRGGTVAFGSKVTPDAVPRLARENDLVIGADGPGSQVAKAIGSRITTRLGIQYRVHGSTYKTDRLEFYTDKRFSPEYSWIFPKGDVLNVGILAESDGKDWERLDKFMEWTGCDGKKAVKEAYPIGFGGTVIQKENVVTIGDAAGLTNPVTKGGLAAIIYAAEILADCVASDSLREYAARIRAHPISSEDFNEALNVIVKYTNRDFERLLRFAPRDPHVGDGQPAGKYGRRVLLTCLANPHRIRDIRVLYRAMALSRRYSW
ncbi:MAG: NAD(P)/FAD-dependent oxidoreductase [Methanobacteriota archaeon]